MDATVRVWARCISLGTLLDPARSVRVLERPEGVTIFYGSIHIRGQLPRDGAVPGPSPTAGFAKLHKLSRLTGAELHLDGVRDVDIVAGGIVASRLRALFDYPSDIDTIIPLSDKLFEIFGLELGAYFRISADRIDAGSITILNIEITANNKFVRALVTLFLVTEIISNIPATTKVLTDMHNFIIQYVSDTVTEYNENIAEASLKDETFRQKVVWELLYQIQKRDEDGWDTSPPPLSA